MVSSTTILILGNTPEGALLASYWKERGIRTLLLGRKRDQNPFTRLEAWGRSESLEVKALPQIEIFHVSAAVVTVQSFDIIGILARHIHYLPAGIPILCLTHGGMEKKLAQFFSQYPKFAWRIATCEHDLQEPTPGFFRSTTSQFRLVWGPFFSQEEKTVVEVEWERVDPHFFHWVPQMVREQRVRWLYELIIGSLTAAQQLKTCGELLDRMDVLAQVFAEGYQLGQEWWQEWAQSEDKLYEGLISLISKRANIPSLMYEQTVRKQRTENEVFAGAASEKYPHLWELAKKIERMPQSNQMGG